MDPEIAKANKKAQLPMNEGIHLSSHDTAKDQIVAFATMTMTADKIAGSG